jgi:hypothetical protein
MDAEVRTDMTPIQRSVEDESVADADVKTDIKPVQAVDADEYVVDVDADVKTDARPGS